MAELIREEKYIPEGFKEGRNKIIENGKVVRIDIKKKYYFVKGGGGRMIIEYKIKEYRR